MPLYIEEEDNSTEPPTIAYYGPWEEPEITERINDAYADLLAGDANLDVVSMTEEEASKIYINPPSFWMEQLKS